MFLITSSSERPRSKWCDTDVITQLSETLKILRNSPEGKSYFGPHCEETLDEKMEKKNKETKEKETRAANSAAFRIAKWMQNDFGLSQTCYELAGELHKLKRLMLPEFG